MPPYRDQLPQLDGRLFLTDGGIETTLIFHEGIELPYFAAFHLLRDERGRTALRNYYARYAAIARREGVGFILESPTWRASADWGEKLGYSQRDLAQVNRDSIALMQDLRQEFQSPHTSIVISGCIGPRGDGYDPGQLMSPNEAEAYHLPQVRAFAEVGADMVAAITITNANEAVGIARAAQRTGMPAAISFTLETDGRLPTGQTLKDALEQVDAATGGSPAYYMINCAHPTHFKGALSGGRWVERIRGLRANASRRSHQELNEAPDLDDGDPAELGGQYGDLLRLHPQINVLGGCCGTDHRHIEHICRICRNTA
jgi:S-methylmethionine-dependent homocysteine/selenocysteine methylase